MHPRIRELQDYYDAQRAVLRAAFERVPATLRDRPPAPDCWSAANIVEHLAIVEARLGGMLASRIAAARAEGLGAETSDRPILPTIDLTRVLDRATRVTAPETVRPTGLGADAAWQALERATDAVRGALRDGNGLALGSVTHPHPLFGPINVYQWLASIAAHEARHAAQIDEIAASAAVK